MNGDLLAARSAPCLAQRLIDENHSCPAIAPLLTLRGASVPAATSAAALRLPAGQETNLIKPGCFRPRVDRRFQPSRGGGFCEPGQLAVRREHRRGTRPSRFSSIPPCRRAAGAHATRLKPMPQPPERNVPTPARAAWARRAAMRFATAVAACLAAAIFPARGEGRALPLTLVDGRIVLDLTLRNAAGREDSVSVELSLDEAGTLLLHSDQLAWTGADPSARDSTLRVTLAGELALDLPAAELRPDTSPARVQDQNRVTRLFAADLRERKLKGVLGLGFLRNHDFTLDLSARRLLLRLRRAAEEDGAPPAAGGHAFPFTTAGGRILFQVTLPGGTPARMILGSSRHDTLVDPALARRLGRPDGDISPVTLAGGGGLELSREVALRPLDWRVDAADGGEAEFLSGVNLLESFRLDVEWSSARAVFTRLRDPATSPADRSFFAARAADTAEAYEVFLEANPGSRFGPEAARRLIELRFKDPLGLDVAVLAALQRVADTSPPDRRTENCLPHVLRLASLDGQAELAIQAARLALQHSRSAVTVQHVYRLHRILGEKHLERDELAAAWRHLLSAAFVPIARDPEHAFRVALGLARVYERQDRPARAYSRYRAALAVPGAPLSDELRAEINAAMERLRGRIAPDQLELLDS